MSAVAARLLVALLVLVTTTAGCGEREINDCACSITIGGETAHLGCGEIAVMARKVGAVAVVPSAAEKEHLDAGRAAGLVRGNNVEIAQPFEIDVLLRLDRRQGANPIAVQRRRFELERLARSLHARAEIALHLPRAAGKKIARLRDQPGIVLA